MLKKIKESSFKFIFSLLFLLSAGSICAAPLVVIPGEAVSYVYYPSFAISETAELIGTPGLFPTTAPSGWLECDGSTIQATDYPRLVAYLAGPNATSAVLPDLRGEFVRGWDHGRGIDAGRVLGSVQASEIQLHTHVAFALSMEGDHTHTGRTDNAGSHVHKMLDGVFVDGSFDDDHLNQTGPESVASAWSSFTGVHTHTLTVDMGGNHSHSILLGSEGNTESRPRNIALIFAIKAF